MKNILFNLTSLNNVKRETKENKQVIKNISIDDINRIDQNQKH